MSTNPTEPESPETPDPESLVAGMWFRPTLEVRQALERVGKAEKRNLSNVILVLVDEALAARRREQRAA
jgi:hypothetical protein